ncbi:unnamed protein product [Nyctereutes procyonoides]|uniref:(raccoon dog) hypothetical protein n=1 Tax=Nyctereutes procyonoides TaxID=34880 RepID=A0A811YEB6_NYCPR|nr:unnamed protein product [Nyctereutes procyonoides]
MTGELSLGCLSWIMDGDCATAPASQSHISADYVGGSHMNDHEDINGSRESFREQDTHLPIENEMPKNAFKNINEFISFITSEASERCFHSLIEPLKLYLQEFREVIKGDKRIGGTIRATDGQSNELTEGTFPNQLPPGLIIISGVQQDFWCSSFS